MTKEEYMKIYDQYACAALTGLIAGNLAKLDYNGELRIEKFFGEESVSVESASSSVAHEMLNERIKHMNDELNDAPPQMGVIDFEALESQEVKNKLFDFIEAHKKEQRQHNQ